MPVTQSRGDSRPARFNVKFQSASCYLWLNSSMKATSDWAFIADAKGTGVRKCQESCTVDWQWGAHDTRYVSIPMEPSDYRMNIHFPAICTRRFEVLMPVRMAKRVRECNVCGEAATKICSQCRCRHYCGQKCQRQDWRSHKQYCAKSTPRGKSEEVEALKKLWLGPCPEDEELQNAWKDFLQKAGGDTVNPMNMESVDLEKLEKLVMNAIKQGLPELSDRDVVGYPMHVVKQLGLLPSLPLRPDEFVVSYSTFGQMDSSTGKLLYCIACMSNRTELARAIGSCSGLPTAGDCESVLFTAMIKPMNGRVSRCGLPTSYLQIAGAPKRMKLCSHFWWSMALMWGSKQRQKRDDLLHWMMWTLVASMFKKGQEWNHFVAEDGLLLYLWMKGDSVSASPHTGIYRRFEMTRTFGRNAHAVFSVSTIAASFSLSFKCSQSWLDLLLKVSFSCHFHVIFCSSLWPKSFDFGAWPVVFSMRPRIWWVNALPATCWRQGRQLWRRGRGTRMWMADRWETPCIMYCVKWIQMGWLGRNALAKPSHWCVSCKLPVAVQDGYIDKDELYFVLDRVGTFKKAKWSLAEFLFHFVTENSSDILAASACCELWEGPICTRHWTNYWQAELRHDTEVFRPDCSKLVETGFAGLDTNSDGFVETWPNCNRQSWRLHMVLAMSRNHTLQCIPL